MLLTLDLAGYDLDFFKGGLEEDRLPLGLARFRDFLAGARDLEVPDEGFFFAFFCTDDVVFFNDFLPLELAVAFLVDFFLPQALQAVLDLVDLLRPLVDLALDADRPLLPVDRFALLDVRRPLFTEATRRRPVEDPKTVRII